MTHKSIQKRRKRARLGQHFLRDPFVLDRIIEFCNPRPGEHLVEIGAGRGELTRTLARRVEPGGHVTALELDDRLAENLKREFADQPHVSIAEGDALAVDFSNLSEMKPGAARIRVIGNLPYYAATAILLNLVQCREAILDLVVMIQKEVADRISAQPGTKDYGTLTLAVQLWCEVERGFDVEPEAFSPPPRVSSTVLRLVPQKEPRTPIRDPVFFERLARAAFAQRRKTLSNNLRSYFGKDMEDRIKDTMAATGIDPARRAETLCLEEFARLSDHVRRSLKDGPNE